jgi:hypothetical protein
MGKMKIFESGSIDFFFQKNILYIENFPTHLLSISKIVQELNYEIIFTLQRVLLVKDFLKIDFIILMRKNITFWQKKKDEEMGTLWYRRIGIIR